MFTAEGSSTYYAVYVIRRAFLSSDKELGLKWHMFGLVGSVSYTDFLVISDFFRGPSDGLSASYAHGEWIHVCVHEGLSISWLGLLSCSRLVAHVMVTFLVTSQGIQVSSDILCKISRHCLSQHSFWTVF